MFVHNMTEVVYILDAVLLFIIDYPVITIK